MFQKLLVILCVSAAFGLVSGSLLDQTKMKRANSNARIDYGGQNFVPEKTLASLGLPQIAAVPPSLNEVKRRRAQGLPPETGLPVLQSARTTTDIAKWAKLYYGSSCSYSVGHDYFIEIGTNYSGISSRDIYLFENRIGLSYPWKLIYVGLHRIEVNSQSDIVARGYVDLAAQSLVLVGRDGIAKLYINLKKANLLLRSKV